MATSLAATPTLTEPMGLPAPTKAYGHLNAETVLSVRRWTDRLFSFRTTRDPSLRFENGQFTMIGIEVEGKPLLRAYSMASANYEEHLEFLSIQVPDGPLTSRLGHVRVGDTVLVGRKPVGTLIIGNLKPGRNLYLFATGTGLAPFMAVIHDPETYDRFDHVILTHGCRHIDELAYQDYIREELPKHELLGEMIDGKLLYYPTVTREAYQTTGRITELFNSGKLFADLGLPPADPALDRAMICGNERMLADCEKMLVDAGFEEGTNSAPGAYVIEKAFVEK
jgi:ferredoxin--NADP+ reductase